MPSLNIFQIVERLTNLKQPINFNDEDEAKSYDVYMIDKALSMCEVLIPIVAKVVKMNLPKEVHAAYYLEVLPKRSFALNWIKADKDLTYEEKMYIANYYNCSFRKAEEYLKILTDDQIKDILKNYKYGVNKKINV